MSKDNKTTIKLMLAYLSFIVGAGFTTGQELLQFFVCLLYTSPSPRD